MKRFTTKLIREKFLISNADKKLSHDQQNALSAPGNRMRIQLLDANEQPMETFIVRGQNMHITARMAARILHTFEKSGPLLARSKAFDWADTWHSITHEYEGPHNPNKWIVVYANGKVVFSEGSRHPFLDVIEKCDIENQLNYDFAVPMAEEMLNNAGQNININYDANVALNITVNEDEARCGIIVRGARSTTFSFMVKPREGGDKLNIAQVVTAAASFLEGIQLAFTIGFDTHKRAIGIIEKMSPEEKKLKSAVNRLRHINTQISSFEEIYSVHYRPEKPAFHEHIRQAEILARETIEDPNAENEIYIE